ncbi:MAG: FHA domain-containing protein [Curtobacterium sp.]
MHLAPGGDKNQNEGYTVARRRKDEGAPERPVVTHAEVERDRQAGHLSRAWVLPSAPVSDREPDAVVHTDQPLPTIGVVPRLVLEVAPGSVVPLDQPVVLGRKVQTVPGRRAVLLDDPGRSVSREHAAIRPTGDGGLVVEDLGSANGTVVVRASGAQEPSVGGAQVVARPGDVVMVGDYAVRVLAG